LKKDDFIPFQGDNKNGMEDKMENLNGTIIKYNKKEINFLKDGMEEKTKHETE
jgi:hypothetical protein